ncbi:SDR family oxidoreductase [Cyanobium gracile]|uniref:SDR family oxidoreductase n=1 Tax=Cyanobium gracile TaxID=59930 RepID=UPI000318ADA7|nr:SDR family oxidoreductase [Cyanobium gracile]
MRAQALFASVLEPFGRLDIVVNNAGVSVFTPTTDIDEADDDRVIDTNGRGTFFTLQETTRHGADGGRIINLASGVTRQALPAARIYAASKAAVEPFGMALVKELGPPGISGNPIGPGGTDTDGLIMPAEALAHRIASTPLGPLGQPGDLAGVVAFLASDDARWVNGQTLQVNGGIL